MEDNVMANVATNIPSDGDNRERYYYRPEWWTVRKRILLWIADLLRKWAGKIEAQVKY